MVCPVSCVQTIPLFVCYRNIPLSFCCPSYQIIPPVFPFIFLLSLLWKYSLISPFIYHSSTIWFPLSLLQDYSLCVSPVSSIEIFPLSFRFSTTGIFPLCFHYLLYWNIPPVFPLYFILEHSLCVYTVSTTRLVKKIFFSEL